MSLLDDVLAGKQRAIARMATHIENGDAIGRAGLEALYPRGGHAHVVGVTGPPGAGKSTLVGGLIGEFRRLGRRVGVVAVDPSSALSGGATLGDRIRMLDRQADADVFIRSMASRGRVGGIAAATAGIVHLLDAAGFDIVIVETVGVGQEQLDVSHLAHTVVLLQVPASGDGVQLLKAGLLEVADVFVVNKADLAGADEMMRGLRSLVGSSATNTPAWTPPIVRCSASTGDGVETVAEAIRNHMRFLSESDRLSERQESIARDEVADHVSFEILRRLRHDNMGNERIDALVGDVVARRLAPLSAAERLLDDWRLITQEDRHES